MDRRNQSKDADKRLAKAFLTVTREIGRELDADMAIITLATHNGNQAPKILDIGMAPRGFTATVLEKHPAATIQDIILPRAIEGLAVMLPRWKANPRFLIDFTDVTILTNVMGRSKASVPTTHLELTVCGASVQCAQPRANYRDSRERLRLATTQVILLLTLRMFSTLIPTLHHLYQTTGHSMA
jgi:hypothetical protein